MVVPLNPMTNVLTLFPVEAAIKLGKGRDPKIVGGAIAPKLDWLRNTLLTFTKRPKLLPKCQRVFSRIYWKESVWCVFQKTKKCAKVGNTVIDIYAAATEFSILIIRHNPPISIRRRRTTAAGKLFWGPFFLPFRRTSNFRKVWLGSLYYLLLILRLRGGGL